MILTDLNDPVIAPVFILHADELLQVAVEHAAHNLVGKLLQNYKAHPNALIDGKPSLFKATYSRIINDLLDAGADPSIKVDDCFF